jgi:hypothetical protein
MSQDRELTYAEFLAEAKERFGEDALNIAFQCPSCGDVATIREFPPGARHRAGQECIGRTFGALSDTGYTGRGRGCDWAAYGLILAPWAITMADGSRIYLFPFADAPPAVTS